MNTETQAICRPNEASSPIEGIGRGWRLAFPAVILAILAILAIYRQTAESIVEIWARSETFAHGYMIVPISVALIWGRRKELSQLVPSPDYLGFVLLGGLGLAWLVASAGQVQVLQQYAMVAMIPAAVIAIAGRRVAWALAFPLAFLLLGVPIGEVLIPPLMDWTANFTVTALKVSGIPVFREGTFFSIPSGNWSVVEGCSGLRYLIASITVGTLYAYLTYQKLWKRMLFVALSVIVPIIANGFRAYMIVMIAHLSDMKLALGVDHLIYGWVFFGLVMLLLFWIGSLWRDDSGPRIGRANDPAPAPTARPSPAWIGCAAVGAVVLSGAWPLYAAQLDRSAAIEAVQLETPAPARGWSLENTTATDWIPRYQGSATSVFQTYRKGDRVVVLYVGYYPQQRRGAELVTSTNVMVVQKHPVWSNVSESSRKVDLGNRPLDVRQTLLRSTPQRLLVWDFLHISGHELTNPYRAKVLLAANKLLGRGDGGAAVIVAAPYESEPSNAADTLTEFLRDMLPSIDASLSRVESRAGASAHRGATEGA
jgi:exosortase A